MEREMKRIKEPLKASILKQILTLLFRSVENGTETKSALYENQEGCQAYLTFR